MSFFLAQSDPSPAALASWLSVLFYLGGFIATVLGSAWAIKELRKKDEPLPQPLTVKAHDTYTPFAQHTELKLRVDKIAEDIRHGFDRLDQKRSVSIAGLHDDLREAVAGMRSEVKQDITGVQNRINDVLAAVSELRGRVAESFKHDRS